MRIDHKDRELSCGYGMVSNVLIRGYKNLSDNAKMIYLNLCAYAGREEKVFPSRKKQSDDLGRSIRTIQRGLWELQSAGLVEIVPRTGRSNIFLIRRMSNNEVEKYLEKYQKEIKSAIDNLKIKLSEDL